MDIRLKEKKLMDIWNHKTNCSRSENNYKGLLSDVPTANNSNEMISGPTSPYSHLGAEDPERTSYFIV